MTWHLIAENSGDKLPANSSMRVTTIDNGPGRGRGVGALLGNEYSLLLLCGRRIRNNLKCPYVNV